MAEIRLCEAFRFPFLLSRFQVEFQVVVFLWIRSGRTLLHPKLW